MASNFNHDTYCPANLWDAVPICRTILNWVLPSQTADIAAAAGAQQREELQAVPMRDVTQRETDKPESDSVLADVGKNVNATPKPFNGASHKKAVGRSDTVDSLRSRLASKGSVDIQQALDRMTRQPHAMTTDFQRISDSVLQILRAFRES